MAKTLKPFFIQFPFIYFFAGEQRGRDEARASGAGEASHHGRDDSPLHGGHSPLQGGRAGGLKPSFLQGYSQADRSGLNLLVSLCVFILFKSAIKSYFVSSFGL